MIGLLQQFTRSLVGRRRHKRDFAASVQHTFDRLEDRQLLAVDLFTSLHETAQTSWVTESHANASPWLDLAIDIHEDISLSSLLQRTPPVLNSNPSAPATIYLNFTGNKVTDSWPYTMDRAGTIPGNLRNYETPVFDTDNDPDRLSDMERATITEIWQRVADDFSPFNVNVTTSYSGSFGDLQAVNVAIGGSYNGWFTDPVSGYGTDGGFSNSETNTVLVFSDTIERFTGDGHGRPTTFESAVAGTISHEVGHALGLSHHRLYDANGKVTDEYAPGTWAWTPLMGDNLSGLRTTFSAGQVNVIKNTWDGIVSYTPVFQNDLEVIAGEQNGFGWRADDFGDYSSSSATLRNKGLGQMSVTGIIGSTSDRDVFRFYTSGGQVHVTLDGPTGQSNLAGKLSLWSAAGDHGFSMMPWDSSHAELSAELAAGTYYVTVSSLGGIGNVGMYELNVDLPSRVLTDWDAQLFEIGHHWFPTQDDQEDAQWLDDFLTSDDALLLVDAVDEFTQNAVLEQDAPWPNDLLFEEAPDESLEPVVEPEVIDPEPDALLPTALVGDVNLDGVFDTSDLVLVFQSGKYEDAAATDVTFAEGDWNEDGYFDSSDLVLAFQSGNYAG